MSGSKKIKNRRNTPSTTPLSIIVVSDKQLEEKDKSESLKGWRQVYTMDKAVVACFVDNQRKKDDKLKTLARSEWKETKNKLIVENLQKKRDCLNSKVNK